MTRLNETLLESGLDVEAAPQFQAYFKRFEQAMGPMEQYLQQGRGLKESLLIAFGLVNGAIASYQSFAFGSKFTRRVLGPSEANAPSWLADSLAPLSGFAAFAANAMIPVISSDIATIASVKMFACLVMGVLNTVTCFQSSALKKFAKKQEWYSASAFMHSIAVLAGGILGSIANSEAAHDSVEDQSYLVMLLVTITNVIVQILCNTRSVMLLLSQDDSHLKRTRLQAVNELLPDTSKNTPEEIHNRSFGSKKHSPMPVQVLLLGTGLLFACVYNYAAAIRPIELDNPSWNPVLRHGSAAINFFVKTILLTRATSAQSRRIMQSKCPQGAKIAGYILLGLLGILSVSGAAEYPKRYLFDDDNSLSNSIISIVIAEGACLALNAGDMLDAGRIIYNFIVNKVIMEWMCCHKPTPEARLGSSYADMLENAMEKVQGEDMGDEFYYKRYQPEETDCDDAVTVTEKPRSVFMTAADLRPAYRQLGADYMSSDDAVKYYPKEKGKLLFKATQELSEVHGDMYQDHLQYLGGRSTEGAEAAAKKFADDGMEHMYGIYLQRLQQHPPSSANRL